MTATLLLTGLSTSLCAQAHAEWLRVSDGTLSVYTQQDPAQASSLLVSLFQFRSALAQAAPFHINQSASLKVVAFPSGEEFNHYRLNAGSCAFFQQTRRAEYVVLQDLSTSRRDIAAHEFTHFVLAHAGVNLPLWLNEGLADFYSTYQISADHVTFGHSVSGRLPLLREYAWLPLPELFQISTGSTYYSDPERMALFYSESWALTHMLLVSPSYASHFPEFLRALNQGSSGVESLRVAFDKTPQQVEQDLHAYLDRQHLPLLEAQFQSPSAGSPAIPVIVSSAEMELTFTDLAPPNR